MAENKKNLPTIPIFIEDWELNYGHLSLKTQMACMKVLFKMRTLGDVNTYKILKKNIVNLWKCDFSECLIILNELKSENLDENYFIFTKKI